MRLKNVKGASDKIESSLSVVKSPEEYIGKWNEIFKNSNPIHIEIGMGKGNFIIGNAKKYPHINFIGIEMFDSVIVRAIEKLEVEEIIPNLRLIRMDATTIETIFKKEIDCIYLNFSDPWPKKRHQNRRLSSALFLKRYDAIFKNIPTIKMKTDNRKLFEYSIMSIANYGYSIDEISLDLYQDDVKDNISTEYEERFANKGFPIYLLEASKID